MSRLVVLALSALLLTGCMDDAPTRDQRGLPNDSSKTPREVCVESCNRESDVCSDNGSYIHDYTEHSFLDTFGSGGECSKELADCLHNCRGAGLPQQE